MVKETTIPKGYKQTDIGNVPKGWVVKHISEFTDTTAGGTPSTFIREYWDGDIRWMNSGELNLKRVFNVEGRITEAGMKNSATRLLPPFCILIGLAGQGKTRGTVAMNMVELCTNQSIAAILPSEEVKNDYLYYNLDSRYNELRGLSTGDGGRGGLNLAIIKKLPVPFPVSEPEQTAIATVLSDVDELISSLEQLIAKKRGIKQGAMQELLTGKRRLPGFSGEWKEKQLNECGLLTMGQSPPGNSYSNNEFDVPLLNGAMDLKENGICMVKETTIPKGYKHTDVGVIPQDWDIDTIANLTSITTGAKNTQDRIDDGTYPFFVRSPNVERINSYSFDGEAVLTAGDGGTGKIFHYIKGKFDFHQRVYKISDFCKRLDGYFFYLYFSNNFYVRIMQMTAKSSVDSVRREMIAEMKVPLPLPAEQTAIATVLGDMDSEIEQLKQKLNKCKMFKTGLMQVLLTGRIRLV